MCQGSLDHRAEGQEIPLDGSEHDLGPPLSFGQASLPLGILYGDTLLIIVDLERNDEVEDERRR